MEIRLLERGDRAAFLNMIEDFYRSPAVSHDIPHEHFVRTFETCVSGSPYARCYLFFCDGVCAGYGLLALTYSNEAGGLCIWIEEIYILPAFRGKGIGSAFFARVKDDFPDAKRFRLEVMRDNDAAIRLYERLGYTEMPYLQMTQDLP